MYKANADLTCPFQSVKDLYAFRYLTWCFDKMHSTLLNASTLEARA